MMKIKGKDYIEYSLRELKVEYEKEFRFHHQRKFRFDFYFEHDGKKIGIEYDGLFSPKSRHTTVTGFSTDTEKTNLAQLNGYMVLRYTAKTYENFHNDLRKILGIAVIEKRPVTKKLNKGHQSGLF